MLRKVAKKLLKDSLTSSNCQSYMFAKVWGAFILTLWVFVSMVAFFVLNVHIDLNGWGGVTTGIYSAVNLAIRATHITEPTQTDSFPQDK